MTDQSLQFPRFFVTVPGPCPYIAGYEERKVFTELKGPDAEALNEALSRVGFRRSQSVAYRPACRGCAACISVRVLARDFSPSRRQRRIAARNRDLEVRRLPAQAREEQYDLLKRYLDARHADGGMAAMDLQDYADMVENTAVSTAVFEYRLPAEEGGHLMAVALSDEMSDGLSMVYSFFDPEAGRRSLGHYMILEHIARAAGRGQDHVYLGYWIADSPKMAYKAEFLPLERLGPEGWQRVEK